MSTGDDQAITPRQAKLIEGYLATGTVAGAARASGYTRPHASALINGDLMAHLHAACAEAGATPDAVATALAEALQAERLVQQPDGKGGATVTRVPDHAIRLRAVELLVKSYVARRSEPAAAPLPEDIYTREEIQAASYQELLVMIRKTQYGR
jgi:hypothetical protein